MEGKKYLLLVTNHYNLIELAFSALNEEIDVCRKNNMSPENILLHISELMKVTNEQNGRLAALIHKNQVQALHTVSCVPEDLDSFQGRYSLLGLPSFNVISSTSSTVPNPDTLSASNAVQTQAIQGPLSTTSNTPDTQPTINAVKIPSASTANSSSGTQCAFNSVQMQADPCTSTGTNKSITPSTSHAVKTTIIPSTSANTSPAIPSSSLVGNADDAKKQLKCTKRKIVGRGKCMANMIKTKGLREYNNLMQHNTAIGWGDVGVNPKETEEGRYSFRKRTLPSYSDEAMEEGQSKGPIFNPQPEKKVLGQEVTQPKSKLANSVGAVKATEILTGDIMNNTLEEANATSLHERMWELNGGYNFGWVGNSVPNVNGAQPTGCERQETPQPGTSASAISNCVSLEDMPQVDVFADEPNRDSFEVLLYDSGDQKWREHISDNLLQTVQSTEDLAHLEGDLFDDLKYLDI